MLIFFYAVAGFITSLHAVPPGPMYKCAGTGNCPDDKKCESFCFFYGYKNGGRCFGRDPQSKNCCCIII